MMYKRLVPTVLSVSLALIPGLALAATTTTPTQTTHANCVHKTSMGGNSHTSSTACQHSNSSHMTSHAVHTSSSPTKN